MAGFLGLCLSLFFAEVARGVAGDGWRNAACVACMSLLLEIFERVF